LLIKEWMASTMLTVDAATSVMRATRVMKENNIRRLPVLLHGKLVGIVTDRDLKEAAPSSTSDIDIHEMYYLLSEMKVADVMTADPVCMQVDDTLAKAAIVMLREKISGVMVLDDEGSLVGLLSETDILHGFIHAAGIQDNAYQYVLEVPDKQGLDVNIIDFLRENNAQVLSMLTSFDDAPAGMKRVSVRILIDDNDKAGLDEKIAGLESCQIVCQGRDDLHNLPAKKR